jgi:Raf kinase inhibitor-like YbhB/YbcL family protein
MNAIGWKARGALAAGGLALASALLSACGSDNGDTGASSPFTLASNDVAHDATIADPYVLNGFGCTGGNISPELHWSNAPAGTKSFVLTVYDPDAPTGSGLYHWVVFDIPASTTSIPTGGPLPAGAKQGFTDFASNAYGGPCPPAADAPHHYVFTLYALDKGTLGLDQTATGALVSLNAKANPLATATFTATYGRGGSNTTKPDVPTAPGFTLTSAEIPADGTIPNEQVFNQLGCTGNNISPTLAWSGAPAATQSLVLTVYDPDALTGSGFWHWLVFDMHASASGTIPKGAGTIPPGLPPGAGGGPINGGTQAHNDYGIRGYGGPCPPAGATAHHYVFTLYAMTVPTLGLPTANAPGGLVGFATLGNAIAKATFTATYGR